jgi:16S rRNA (guanine527-N7)-methyltransferase
MDAPTQALFGDQQELISQYVDILAGRGIEWGLLGPREADRLWARHILNSVALNELVSHGVSVADIGSGAGLPGLPLAILRPDLEVTLIEPLLRRSTFLSGVVDELGLGDRVRVVRSRAEEHKGRYDVVTSRALAPLGRLLTWSEPLRAPAGQILALKGSSAQDEVDANAQQLRTRRLVAELLTARAHPTAEPATIVRISRAH